MPQPTINQRIYGPAIKFPDIEATPAVPPSQSEALTRVPLGTAVQGSSAVADGQAAEAEANRERAGVFEATGAAMSQWSAKHVWDALNQTKFEPDPAWNPTVPTATIKYPLTLDEEAFFHKTRSREEFEHKLIEFTNRKGAEQAMGDSTVGTLMGTFTDPAFLAISAASGGAGGLAGLAGATARGAKMVAGATAFGTAYTVGKIEQEVTPISDQHVFANAMMFGAAEALLFKQGKVLRADPDAPTPRLHELARDMEDSTRPQPMAEIHPDFVGPAREFPEPVPPAAGDNLTRSRVAPGGEAGQDVTYGNRGRSAASDYLPEVGLGRNEQAAIHMDGVTHVNSVADIAEHSAAVRNGSTVIADDAKAVYLPGEDRVYIVRNNIKPGDDLKGILLHEVGVHMNAERVLGTVRMNEMLTRLEDLALKGNKRARAAYESVPKDTPLHLVREEALGYYVEHNHAAIGDHFVGRFVAGVKEVLRKAGLKGLKLSENDIMQLVRKSAKSKAGASFDTAFPYAWHGSAVRGIEQLDTKFLGTGEGNQAFGHGHYLTSEKGTALDYRNKESLRRGINPEEGGLYRVKINAKEHQFVDFDSRVQSATVQAAFEKLGVDITGKTGKQAYEELSRLLGGSRIGGRKSASEALWGEGVAGNKYATGRTRNAEIKSSNYVVYHNDALDMAARYSRPSNAAVKTGEFLEWSLSKTFSSYSKEAAAAAEVLMDNPTKFTGNSVASQHRAILADFAAHQTVFENTVLDHMAEAGYGTRKQITHSTDAIAAQNVIERKLADELSRQNRLSHDGKPITFAGVDPKVKAMADQYNAITKAAYDELKASGAAGAEGLEYHPGYYPRRWDNVSIEGIKGKLVAGGMTEQAAQQVMEDSVSMSIQRATGMDAQVASDVAKATLDRARRKGYFEDTSFRGSMGAEATAEVRDILLSSGISNQRVERALEVMMGASDEAGKASMLKHRVDMALDEPIGNSGHTIADMIDSRIVHLTEGYLHKTAATAAFARKGLKTVSDIQALRQTVMESIPEQGKRAEAAKLFDGTVATLRGEPVGEDMNRALRISRGLTQMVGLKMAGLFQFTEFSTLMARHGMAATVTHMLAEAPGLRQLLGNQVEAGHLRDVLVRNCTEDMRMRPFVSRMEDNFEIGSGEKAQLAIMQAKQLVPYLNGLKYVQGYQARIAGNLIVKVLEKAAKGDVKAAATLEGYGLESRIMGAIRGDIAAHGMDTLKWSADTWEAVRGPITKMMDDHVLRSRVGELPAFAQFSTLGKFLFTFRSFVLGAHNKVLSGTLQRNGFAGLSLMMAYQFPLTYALVQADNAAMGKKELTMAQAIGATMSQAGSMGLLSELAGLATGTKQQFGSPGTIALDRGYKLGSAIAGSVKSSVDGKGAKWGNIGAAGFNAVPLLSVITPLKVLPELIRDKNTHK